MSSQSTNQLQGLRVLVVEDSFVIAWSLRRMLSEAGCLVVGPASTVRGALELVKAGECDAAILDVNLQGETSMPVADALERDGKPFVFVTGYASPSLVEVKYLSRPNLRKPLSEQLLVQAMREHFVGGRQR